MIYCKKCIHHAVCDCDADKSERCLFFAEEPKQGEWIYKKFDEETGISDSYFCSCCGFPLTGIYNCYCAVCGADMREGEAE